MPNGKPADTPCVQLDSDLNCKIFGKPERPACCSGLQANQEMCGDDRVYALQWLQQLEHATKPNQA